MPDTFTYCHRVFWIEPFGAPDNRLCLLTSPALDEMKIIESMPNVLPIPSFHQDTVAMTKYDVMKVSLPHFRLARFDRELLLKPAKPGHAHRRKGTIITFRILGHTMESAELHDRLVVFARVIF